MSQQLAEIQRALGRIEGTVDEIKRGMARGTEQIDKHDERLDKIERRHFWLTGIVAGAASALGFGGANLLKP